MTALELLAAAAGAGVVAARLREGPFQLGIMARHLRQDVVNLHGNDDLLLRLAVFTLVARALEDLGTQVMGYARHHLHRGCEV